MNALDRSRDNAWIVSVSAAHANTKRPPLISWLSFLRRLPADFGLDQAYLAFGEHKNRCGTVKTSTGFPLAFREPLLLSKCHGEEGNNSSLLKHPLSETELNPAFREPARGFFGFSADRFTTPTRTVRCSPGRAAYSPAGESSGESAISGQDRSRARK